MGSICCGATSHLTPDKGTEVIRLCNKNLIQKYDVSENRYEECMLTSKFCEFQGCSQIQIDNKIYLCGTSKAKYDFDSSYLYCIDTATLPLKVKLEVSSSCAHYYPTLAQYNNEYIFVFGGKKTTKCELYFINYNKWKNIISLPEERYGAVAFLHIPSYSIYLFGGMTSEKKFVSSIIKNSLPSFPSWETVYVKECNQELLQRAFPLTYYPQDSNDKFYILGGEKKNKEISDEILIIEFNKWDMSVKESKIKMKNKISFRHNQTNIYDFGDKSIYYYDDDEKRKKLIKLNIDFGESTEIELNFIG